MSNISWELARVIYLVLESEFFRESEFPFRESEFPPTVKSRESEFPPTVKRRESEFPPTVKRRESEFPPTVKRRESEFPPTVKRRESEFPPTVKRRETTGELNDPRELAVSQQPLDNLPIIRYTRFTKKEGALSTKSSSSASVHGSPVSAKPVSAAASA